MMPISFATHVRLFVEEHGVRDAAKRIGGVSAATMLRLSRGYPPTVHVFMRICRKLDLLTKLFVHEWDTKRHHNERGKCHGKGKQ